jgi:hypothetical protein
LLPIHQTTECSIQKIAPSLLPLYLTSVFSFCFFLCGKIQIECVFSDINLNN